MGNDALYIQMLTSSSLAKLRDGEKIFRALLEILKVTPEFYEKWEPIKTPFDPADLSGPLGKWGQILLWKAKRNTLNGRMSARFGKTIVHGDVSVCDRKRAIDDGNAKAFLSSLSPEFGADFAYIQPLNGRDVASGRLSGSVMTGHPKPKIPTDFFLFVTTHHLRKYIPDLYWGTVFGPAYVRLFGKQKLLSAPAYCVEDWGSEIVYIQLTKSSRDMDERYDEVDAVRRAVKSHLDSNAFFDPKLGAEHTYNVPEFYFTD